MGVKPKINAYDARYREALRDVMKGIVKHHYCDFCYADRMCGYDGPNSMCNPAMQEMITDIWNKYLCEKHPELPVPTWTPYQIY